MKKWLDQRKDTTGFVCSSFDILHTGYAIMLKECKDHCDYLVVGLHDNPSWERSSKNIPIMSLHERFLILKSVRYVNEIAPYRDESDLLNLLNFYRPDIRFLGSDYKDESMKETITGPDVCKNIHYIERFHSYSSSGVRQKIYDAEKYKQEVETFRKNEGGI